MRLRSTRLSAIAHAMRRVFASNPFAQASAIYSTFVPTGITYSGPLVRVRSDADNVAIDIGSINRSFDTAALQAFTSGINYARWSEDFSNALWLKTGATVAAKTITSTTTGSSGVSLLVTVPTGAVNFIADLVTAGTNSPWFRMAVQDGSGSILNVWVNVATGAPSTIDAGLTVTSVSITGGWRVTVTRTLASTNATLFLRIASTNGSQNSGAANRTITVDRVQAAPGTPLYRRTENTAVTAVSSVFVATAYDLTGNGRHAVQPTASLQPRMSNAGVIDTLNSVPVMIGTGANVHMLAPAPMTNSSEFTLFMVSRPTSYTSTGAAGITPWSMAAAATQVQAQAPWSDGIVNFDVGASSGTNRISGPIGVVANTTIVVTYQSSVSQSLQRVRCNSVQIAIDTTGHSVSVTRLSIFGTPEADESLRGAIGPVVVVPSSLSLADVQFIEAELGSYAGIF